MNHYITGATIKQLREMKALTQAQLADSLGVSAKAVSKWETGGATPDLDKLVKMSTLFGVTLDELTGTEPPQHRQPGKKDVHSGLLLDMKVNVILLYLLLV